jgi:hypothetical protein
MLNSVRTVEVFVNSVLTCELDLSSLIGVGQEGVHLLVVVLVVAASNTVSAGAAYAQQKESDA